MLCRRDVKMVQRRLYGALGTLWGPRDFKGISGCLERTWCNNQTCSKSSPLPSFASQSEIVNVIYQHIPLSSFNLKNKPPKTIKVLKRYSRERFSAIPKSYQRVISQMPNKTSRTKSKKYSPA